MASSSGCVGPSSQQDIRPIPSPMEILDVSGKVDAHGLMPWEAALREKARTAALHARSIAQRVIADDLIAGVLHTAHMCPSSGGQRGLFVPLQRCGEFERLYFSQMRSEEKNALRSLYRDQLHAAAQHTVEIALDDPRLDTFMFTDQEEFRHQLEKFGRLEEFDTFMDSVSAQPTHPAAVNAARIFLRTVVSDAKERAFLRNTLLLETAMEKNAGVLGTSWTGITQFYGMPLFGRHTHYIFSKPCALQEREAFYRLPVEEQKRIRMQLFPMQREIGRALAELKVTNDEELAQKTGGKYSSIADLISDDLLFRDGKLFQKIKAPL